MRILTAKLIFFAGLLLVIFYFLFKNFEAAVLTDFLRAFNWKFGLLAFAAYSGHSFLKALRLNFFLENKIKRGDFLKAFFIYNFWNQILPFNSGDLYYMHLVRKSGKVSIGESFASLIAARIFNLFVIGLFAVFSFYFILESGDILNFKKWMIPGAFLIFMIFILTIFFSGKIIAIFNLFFNKTGLFKFKTALFLQTKFNEALKSVSNVKSISRFFIFLNYSVLIFLFDFLFLFLASRSFGLAIGFWQAGIMSILLVFATFILPFQTPANIGTYEGALIPVFMFFGFAKNISAAVSVFIHLQNLVFAFVLFILSRAFKLKND